MKKERRDFIKTAGAFAAGSLIVPFGCNPKKPQETVVEEVIVEEKDKDIGLQLYTLRNQIQELGVEATLERVASIGFKWMELFGYENRMFLGKTPQEINQICANLGMSIPSVHSVTEVSSAGGKSAIIDQMKTTAEDAITAGAKYLVWAYLKEEDRTSMEDYKNHIETWNKFGEICKETGIQFVYHNHDFEFLEFDGVKPYDVIMKETDPETVQFELDLYWITKSGNDPVEYFKKAPGRFPLWHVKDMDPADDFFAPVGQGKLEFEKIFGARGTAGMKYFFVEQDATREGVDPFNTIAQSWNYLNDQAWV